MVSKEISLPSVAFLHDVERLFSTRFPAEYVKFCAGFESGSAIANIPALSGGRFITDLEMLKTLNVKIGKEQWGDYEQAIVATQHPKDSNRLWGGLLPFYFDAEDIYGFSAENDGDEQVYVWSVHTVVHAYPSWAAFVEAKLGF